MIIHVWPMPDSRSYAKLHCGHIIMDAVIGKNGVTPHKHEGDMATPVGQFTLRKVYYRADRTARPYSVLPTEALKPDDGWCDDPTSEVYNQYITLPNAARHEDLWREDDLYNLVIVIGYNDTPALPGKGSAIFMHLQRPDRTPTEGCIALTEQDLRTVLQSGATAIVIHGVEGTPSCAS